jgi:hypothetical protein
MTTPYRLQPAPLVRPWVRLGLLGGWLAGAVAIGGDAVTGPFTGRVVLPAAALCLVTAGLLLWGYRHILFHFATGLDEREAALRARVYRTAFGITAVATLLVWAWIFQAAEAGNGWQLKEIAYLFPLSLLAAPGAAAALTLPADQP